MDGITSFHIEGLHGDRNIEIKLNENTLVLVGENGMGKTTVLRLLYYFLSCQWNTLLQFEFRSLTVIIQGKEHTVQRSDIEEHYHRMIPGRILRRFPPRARKELWPLLEGDDALSPHFLERVRVLCNRYGVPLSQLFQQLNRRENHDYPKENKLNKISEGIKESLGCQLLYLPTYRRIEQNLEQLFEMPDDSDYLRRRHRHRISSQVNNENIELVEFGMQDVQNALSNTLEDLKEFARDSLNTLTLKYLGDVIGEEYEHVTSEKIQEVTEKQIENILKRIDEDILTKENKEHLKEQITRVKEKGEELNIHTKVIYHYFTKLLDLHEKLSEKETHIKRFCEVCNDYLIDKSLVYDNTSFTVVITSSKKQQDIDLNYLSSGEKQIVSLFSYLYLSGNQKYFVSIDEPELSLSIDWQRKILVDIKACEACFGLVAVTHSPFIYENNLKEYAHGLGEFFQGRV